MLSHCHIAIVASSQKLTTLPCVASLELHPCVAMSEVCVTDSSSLFMFCQTRVTRGCL